MSRFNDGIHIITTMVATAKVRMREAEAIMTANRAVAAVSMASAEASFKANKERALALDAVLARVDFGLRPGDKVRLKPEYVADFGGDLAADAIYDVRWVTKYDDNQPHKFGMKPGQGDPRALYSADMFDICTDE